MQKNKSICRRGKPEKFLPNKIIFFFQAEDGIRDSSVTGVQTCALPIFLRRLTCGFARAETKAQRVEAECQKSREIQLTSLRNHVLRFLEVFEGRLDVSAPLAVYAYRTVSPVLQRLLDLTHLPSPHLLRRNLITPPSLPRTR